jgi:hypothetical protein
MVHTWISLRNDRIGDLCLNRRITRIFRTGDAMFYGDYDLDVYIGTKSDYDGLEATADAVIDRSRGWVRNCRLEKEMEYRTLSRVLSEFGSVSDSQLHKVFPRKEKGTVVRTLQYRKDGNFTLLACETERAYYVFCFATS